LGVPNPARSGFPGRSDNHLPQLGVRASEYSEMHILGIHLFHRNRVVLLQRREAVVASEYNEMPRLRRD
jgi:hypothetical protein